MALDVAPVDRLLVELSREVERARGLLLQVMAVADDVAANGDVRSRRRP